MVSAVVLFALAAWLQYDGYQNGDVTTGGVILSVLGFIALTAGGWLGGTIVFVHGIRVLATGDPAREPAGDSATAGDETPTIRR